MRKLVGLAILLAALVVPPAGNAADFTTTLRSGEPRPNPFYPFVRDWYRDNISVVLWESQQNGQNTYTDEWGDEYEFYCEIRPADVFEAVVVNSEGAVVRNLTPRLSWHEDENAVKLQWNGRRDDGSFVRKNAWYQFRVTATPRCIDYWDESVIGWGESEAIGSSTFLAKTAYRSERRQKTKRGRYTSAHGATSNCSSSPTGFHWFLSCYPRGSAWANWTLHRPRHSDRWGTNARGYPVIAWGMWDGPSKVSVVRTAGTTRVVRVTTPGYSWAEVYWVRVFYWVKIRI